VGEKKGGKMVMFLKPEICVSEGKSGNMSWVNLEICEVRGVYMEFKFITVIRSTPDLISRFSLQFQRL
jgi:hypothetical protein